MTLPQSILGKFGFNDAAVQSLHVGISETFLATKPDGSTIIVKVLRETRGAEQSPLSEMAWLSALSAQGLACVRPYFEGAAERNVICTTDQVFSLYRHVEGKEPDRADLKNYALAGALLRQLHEAGARVSVTDTMRQRPVYDRQSLITAFYPIIANLDLFAPDIKTKLYAMGAEIEAHFPPDQIFIHGDFHFGNLLQNDDELTALDFDECGFGPRCYDLGTMRLHTLSAKNDAAWQVFLDAYGRNAVTERNLKYGAAARIFYMIGKVPSRFHVPDVAEDATGIIERYTNGYLTTVLSE